MPNLGQPSKVNTAAFSYPPRRIGGRHTWPKGKQFAFTIFDDTDFQTMAGVQPVYECLFDLGLLTTKSVWPLRGNNIPHIGGVTCEDHRYLSWVINLQARGFEIGLHNVTYHTSTREETVTGLDKFTRLFGHHPYTMANHSGCREGMYWGRARLSGVRRLIYDLVVRQGRGSFEGHVKDSPLFWGDLCRERIRYVRNFTFSEINTLKVCPSMPYHDPDRPFVNYWFAATEGPDVERFSAMLCEENQDRLLSEGGACIMYTHFAQGFAENGRVDRRFLMLMQRLSRMNGWFVPVHQLLDFLVASRNHHNISHDERNRLERRWLFHKVLNSRGRV